MDTAKRSISLQGSWLLVGFIIVGLLLRWTGLDLRPLHHDESIHVMFGRYFFDWPNDNYYKYNPEYHGPLLYNCLRFVYETFGDTENSARGLIAFLGSIFLIIPYLLRRYIDEAIVIALTAFVAISPTLVFWSRFVREDIFVLSGMMLMLWGILGARPTLKIFWVFLGIVFQYASKENSYVTLAMFWGFFLADWLWRKVFDARNEPFPLLFIAPIPFVLGLMGHVGLAKLGLISEPMPRFVVDAGAFFSALLIVLDCLRDRWKTIPDDGSFVAKMFKHIAFHRPQFFSSLVLAAFLFSFLFSAGFRYPEGILDGLYYKGITYWIEKHAVERIKGPFLFHVYQLTWYELFFMIGAVGQAIHFYRRQSKSIKIAAVISLVVAIICGVANRIPEGHPFVEPTFFLWKALKLKNWFDVFGAIILVAHGILLPLGHWQKKQWNLAAFGFFFSATLFTYSYLGEKVPWLSVYPMVGGIIYFAAYAQALLDSGELKWFSAPITLHRILSFTGWVLLGVSLVCIAEESARFATVYPGPFDFGKVLNPFQISLGLGLILLSLGWADRRFPMGVGFTGFSLLLTVFTIFTLRVAYISNFEFKYHELGYMSQVHTTMEAKELALKIRQEILSSPFDSKPSVLVEGDATWPMTWYFRDLSTYKFSATPEEKQKFTYIIQDEATPVPDGFEKATLKLRGWWVPEFRDMTIRRFLSVALNQRVWGGFGYSNVTVLKKR